MKKYLVSFLVLLSFSVHANDWSYAKPIFSGFESTPHVNRSFQSTVVKYRYSEDGKTLEINLYDQYERDGYFSSKAFWHPMKTYREGGVPLHVEDEALLRILAVVSAVPLKLDRSVFGIICPGYSIYGELNSVIEYDNELDKETVVLAFKKKHPNVTKISFIADSKSGGDFLSIPVTDLTYDEDALEDWTTQLTAQGIELDYS